jgi:fatty acid amide hydrolase 2
MHQTLGLVSRQNVKAAEDADVVSLLKKAGGILIAVTNIPEYNLWCESRNNVYGQTLNPYNTTRTVGGSSGGEVRKAE